MSFGDHGYLRGIKEMECFGKYVPGDTKLEERDT